MEDGMNTRALTEVANDGVWLRCGDKARALRNFSGGRRKHLTLRCPTFRHHFRAGRKTLYGRGPAPSVLPSNVFGQAARVTALLALCEQKTTCGVKGQILAITGVS